MNFSKKDIQQIENRGLTTKGVEQQITLFENGIPFANLVSEATIDNGILRVSKDEIENYILKFDDKKNDISILKFVPASGAATRMFKSLFAFLDDYILDKGSINSYINKTKNQDLSLFFIGVEKFPFYAIVLNKLKQTFKDFDTMSVDEQGLKFVQMMLDSDKLDFGNSPAGPADPAEVVS